MFCMYIVYVYILYICMCMYIHIYNNPCYSPVALHALMAYFAACARGIGDPSLVSSGPLFRQCISYTKSWK